MLVRTAIWRRTADAHGWPDARHDRCARWALASLQSDLDTLASELVTRSTPSQRGLQFDVGSTGANFFTGNSTATMGVKCLGRRPSTLQAAGVARAPGNNTVWPLALAQLADAPKPAWVTRLSATPYNQTVASLGYSPSEAKRRWPMATRSRACCTSLARFHQRCLG